MISSLSSYSASYSTNSTSQTKSSNSLSLEDQELIDSILLNYDSDSLSSEDASAIVSAFSNAGIEPSKELSNAMDSLGFDAKEVGELAGVNSRSGMPPPPPPPPSDDSEEEDNVQVF